MEAVFKLSDEWRRWNSRVSPEDEEKFAWSLHLRESIITIDRYALIVSNVAAFFI